MTDVQPLAGSATSALQTALARLDADHGAFLVALAHADPSAALRCLADAPALLDRVPAGDRHALLERVLDGVPGVPDTTLLTALDAVCLHFGDALPMSAFGRLAERLPADARSAPLRALVQRAAARPHGRAPAVVRAAAALAIADGEAAPAHALLTDLGQLEPSLATAQWILRQRKLLAAPDAPVTRVALLGSYTLDQLVPYLDLELRRLGRAPALYVAPFNTWAREVRDPQSGLRQSAPDAAILAVALDDLVPALADLPETAALATPGEAAVQRVVEAAEQYAAWSGKPLIVLAFHSAFIGRGTPNGRDAASHTEWLAALNARLAAALRAIPQTYLLDTTGVLVRSGAGPDAGKLRHLAGMRLPPGAMPELARTLVRYLAPLQGLTRKCVVVDLDNTLWGGVVGEDGPHGVRLGPTSPGAEFVEFQRYLATLPGRGILLALCSKNNPDDALEVIRGHEHMVLRETAFSAVRINWRPKPENLASIAQELNIGVDSLVFVDDNPDEREQMRQLLPQVLTVDLPADPSRYRETVEALPQLQVPTVTAEDRARVELYRANRARDVGRETAVSVEDYLASLEIRVRIAPMDDATLPRVAQLFQRTNQFNVTTRRHDQAFLQRIRTDAGWRHYTLVAGDKFGDHGLVAVALMRRDADVWVVDSFLMSCRVIGYGIETALLATLAAEAAATGAPTLVGEFIPTKKNAPALDVYRAHGFAATEPREGVERWQLALPASALQLPNWVHLHDT